MAALDEIIAFLDDLLDPGAFSDYGPNGLQVPGAAAVNTVATGVSAGARLFERAAEAGADLVLVHHGLFWSGPPRPLDRAAKRRLQLLFEHDMSLAAYHLPLDAHPAHGNNALLAAALGCDRWEPFAGIGMVGWLPEDGIAVAELIDRTRHATGGREPVVFTGGPEHIRSIGIVSGGGSPYLGEAIELGLDAFLTGEPVERVMNQADEAGIHFLAAGHYATETHGVRRLGALVAERFGVEHVWLDVPNPI
ncbi:MAG TPA: Nif3-like dinuclear metal center hexameric protein [Solirubrobacteraceae bacterium]|nr:Nif3-like dinuclear metal center hexameric protein [Solirubrobacteraceae bacterium]